MKNGKLYNIIFPIWLFLFFPPIILFTLAANFIIDSLVLILGCFLFKAHGELHWLTFYRNNILKVWIFGFLADIIGAALLFACIGLQDFLGLPNAVIQGISYDPFSNILAVILIMVAILISGLLILFFNHKFTFHKSIEDELIRWKMTAFIAITTLPWTFLIPMKWFV